MLVRNLNGTSDSSKCPCGSWLKHWERYNEGSTMFCAELTCTESAEVGAHVQKIDEEKNWYIVPLCEKHNACSGHRPI
jgi:hypothetical protein